MKTSILALSVFAAGCIAESPPPVEVSFEDEGRVCAFASDPTPFPGQIPQAFEPDVSLDLVVIMDQCVSSSCTSDIVTACSVSVTGDRIELTSSASYTDDTPTLDACTDDCLAVAATCTTPPLAAGAYTVAHGSETMTLEIPSSAPAPPCIDP